MSEVRYPIEALAAAMRLGAGDARRELRMSGQQWARYEETGMGWESAERFAERAGFHPSEVWETWVQDEMDRVGKTCAADGCEVVFFAENPRRIYCSNVCRDRKVKARWARRKYQDPVFAAAERERLRRYHAEVRDARRRRALPHRDSGEEELISSDASYSPLGAAGSVTA